MSTQHWIRVMYGTCERDWITQQLSSSCLPHWANEDGTYDWVGAEMHRAVQLPEKQFDDWWRWQSQYLRQAERRYYEHLLKLRRLRKTQLIQLRKKRLPQ